MHGLGGMPTLRGHGSRSLEPSQAAGESLAPMPTKRGHATQKKRRFEQRRARGGGANAWGVGLLRSTQPQDAFLLPFQGGPELSVGFPSAGPPPHSQKHRPRDCQHRRNAGSGIGATMKLSTAKKAGVFIPKRPLSFDEVRNEASRVAERGEVDSTASRRG